jgi:N-methylhydantoinase B
MSGRDMDPITLEVFHEALVSTVAEMRVTVLRTAFSSIIYEGQDFSCALTDAQGRLVALSREDTPLHVGPLNLQVPAAVRKFAGELAPGDILLANDPFTAGTHLNDVLVMAPIFTGDRLRLIACIRAHWGDVGGMTPGSISGRATEIFQEGVRIPIIKIYDRGRPNDAALELLFANVRQPRDRRGDFHAQLATAKTAEDRLHAIIRRFGADAVETGVRQILDRTEARMRAQIKTLPAGEYEFEDYMDSDGNAPEPVRIRVRVAVREADLEVDFTGSSPQRHGPVNASLAVAATAVFVTLKALLDPLGHINEGAFRPVRIVAPPGSVVNATYPAPMGGFTEIYRRVSGTLMGALGRAAPARLAGDTKGTANHVYIGFLGEVDLLRVPGRWHRRVPRGGRLERGARMGHRRLPFDPVGRVGRARTPVPRRALRAEGGLRRPRAAPGWARAAAGDPCRVRARAVLGAGRAQHFPALWCGRRPGGRGEPLLCRARRAGDRAVTEPRQGLGLPARIW